jgi:hypothetical protein
MSGRAAPRGTAIATPERTRSVTLPSTIRPLPRACRSRRRPAHDVERFARLHALGRVDAADRFDRHLGAAALLPGRNASARNWRVAIEEMPVIGGVMNGGVISWG